MKVSVLGPAGSYSEIAAKSLFSTVCGSCTPQIFFCSSIENAVLRLFEKDENGEVSNFAVIPVENSIEGAVGVSMDLLLEKDIAVIAEIILPVNHCLFVSKETASRPDFSLDQIQTVYSHPQGIFQCRSFICSQLTNAETIETDSTSKAAKIVAADSADRICAAIASAAAGKEYGLEALQCNIQSNPNNSTRFVLVVRSESLPAIRSFNEQSEFNLLPEYFSQTGSGDVFYKTSLAITPKHDRPGALFQILEVFNNYQINLTRIESRPSKKALGEYFFFIDFEGNPSESNSAQALALVEERSAHVKILGTYGRVLPSRQ